MNVREMIRTEKTGNQFTDSMVPITCAITETKEEIGPSGFGVLQEYTTTLTVATRYRANGAQYQEAREIAVNRLIMGLHDEALSALRRVKQEVMGGNQRGAIEAILEAERHLKGEG